jgi:hypothetical protein
MGAEPPLRAWATPPLTSRESATCPDDLVGRAGRTDREEDLEVELTWARRVTTV